MSALLTAFRETPYKLIARVRADNSKSSHIICKLGGRRMCEEPSLYEIMKEKEPEIAEQFSDLFYHYKTVVYEFENENTCK